MPLTKYIWEVENDSYLMETDATDTTTAVYTNEPAPFGNVISQRRGNTTSTYHYDALGSTRALTDSTETVTDTYIYTAFGESVATTGTTTNHFRYVGQLGYYFDTETDDYYVRARTYNPTIARWIAADPILSLVRQGRYTYVLSNPVGRHDPSGLVIRDFDPDPTKIVGMDWCSVGVGTQDDEEGVDDPSIAGETGIKAYEIVCACQCCNRKKNLYRLRCIVHAHLQIKINKSAKMRRHLIYGHEQRHVQNLLDGAEVWASEAARREGKVGCGALQVCVWEKTLLEFVGNNALQNWIEREREHGITPPEEDEGYWPLPENAPGPHGGPIPDKSDCSKPGKTKTPPKFKNCC